MHTLLYTSCTVLRGTQFFPSTGRLVTRLLAPLTVTLARLLLHKLKGDTNQRECYNFLSLCMKLINKSSLVD